MIEPTVVELETEPEPDPQRLRVRGDYPSAALKRAMDLRRQQEIRREERELAAQCGEW